MKTSTASRLSQSERRALRLRTERPPRLLRDLQIQFDRFRVWSKITWHRGRVLATTGDSWKGHDAPEYLADPELFYRGERKVPVVTTAPVRRRGMGDAEVLRFTFPTLHRMPIPETNTAHGRFYGVRGVPDAPVVLISHGWAHRMLRTIEHLYVRPFLKAGFAVAFVSHPMHLERTPRGSYSGELVVSADVVLTVDAFRQGVIDLIGAADWLRSRGHSQVGVLGYSLGGYLAGIMAAVRGDWSFVVMGGAGHSPVSPILDTPLGTNVREDLAACGMDRASLERAWTIISPGAFTPKVPKERILLVAGLYDQIMLPRSVRRLWNTWDRPALHWLRRSHYTLLALNGGLLSHAIPFMRERAPRR